MLEKQTTNFYNLKKHILQTCLVDGISKFCSLKSNFCILSVNFVVFVQLLLSISKLCSVSQTFVVFYSLLVNFVRTLPCPTYSRWTLPESRWFSGVHLESSNIFFGWEHSQIGMHNPSGFHQESRWTPHEPSGVSGVHLPDSRVESTWTQARNNLPGGREESKLEFILIYLQ